jgi:hypothetical protein
VVESRSGTKGDEGLGRGRTDGDRESGEARDVDELDRKRRVRERESGTGEIVDSLDDARIKQNNRFVLTLMEGS